MSGSGRTFLQGRQAEPEQQASEDERAPTHYAQFIQLTFCNPFAGRGAGEVNFCHLALQASDRERERAHPQARVSSCESAASLRCKERAAF